MSNKIKIFVNYITIHYLIDDQEIEFLLCKVLKTIDIDIHINFFIQSFL